MQHPTRRSAARSALRCGRSPGGWRSPIPVAFRQPVSIIRPAPQAQARRPGPVRAARGARGPPRATHTPKRRRPGPFPGPRPPPPAPKATQRYRPPATNPPTTTSHPRAPSPLTTPASAKRQPDRTPHDPRPSSVAAAATHRPTDPAGCRRARRRHSRPPSHEEHERQYSTSIANLSQEALRMAGTSPACSRRSHGWPTPAPSLS